MTAVPGGPGPAPGLDLPRPTLRERYEDVVLGTLSVLAFLAAWELVAATGVANPLFISSPSRVLTAAAGMFSAGDIWRHIYVSFLEFVIGFTLSIAVGVPLGALAGWYRRMHAIVNPFVAAFNATPRVALLPLIVIWIGIGLASKVAIVFLGAVFPIMFNMMAALRTIDASMVRMARSFGARDAQIFRTIALPSSVPFLITGLRLGAGRGLVGIVVGELYAANAGVGFLIAQFGTTFQTDRLFVGVLIITCGGVALDVILRRLERRFELWRPRVGA